MDWDRITLWLADDHVALAGIPVSGLAVVLGASALLFFGLWRRSRGQTRRLRTRLDEAGGAGPGVEAVLKAQAELAGRLQTMTDVLGSRQSELASTLSGRFDGLSHTVGRSIMATTSQTKDSLSALGERLAVIDEAQNRIGELASGISKLQDVLGDKQSRGAFGELRMQTIIADALPASGYRMQAALSNGKRPDCLIQMPNGSPPLVIDSKFPLDAYAAMASAKTPEQKQFAASRMRRDMDVHIRAIASKYLIAGETLDTALMFVPSETIFAFLGERFPDIVQKAFRARVVIVSPTLLMLSVQVIQNLLKDARVREEAGRIQAETRHLAEDIARLDERVGALRNHFGQSARDIDQILITTAKITRRAETISDLPLRDEETGPTRSALL
ncbi:DNA recombination protein RmuC [Fulvimarina sp. 2208YS6-2-32]|uniref:DNA recombination protein RmuC homolog n=1 Tax=Fulvimarina uroteuthidis TaxID=3098149 RepID=A0ABU5I6I9_9HYPH|nr:DNA recombination protein RmuC [Fulvimarina sp. 2208YS6-2-32]MDY8110424.1 DNA recombination protein RmuC [Fulvimarina sp. 2208YS6-2-32]